MTRVLRRPVLSLVLAGGVLLALALPALQLRTVQPGIDTYPQSLDSIQTYNRIDAAFPGSEIPAEVVVKAPDIAAPEVQEAIAALQRQALATGQMHEPVTVDVNQAGTVAAIGLLVDGDGTNEASESALAALREDVIPATVGTLPNAEVAVTGFTAQSKDFNDKLKSVAPLVFGFVLLLAFVLMLVAFRVARDCGEGDRPEPDLDRGRLRRARARLPARDRQEHPRLRVDGQDRRVPADLPVRDPLRALDGLPRLHPEPDSGRHTTGA